MVTENFEYIHRSHLAGMGVATLQLQEGENRQSLRLARYERITIQGLAEMEEPRKIVTATTTYADRSTKEMHLLRRVGTGTEVDYMRIDGASHYMLQQVAA